MLVKNWMSTPVVTVSADDKMDHAIQVLKRNTINMVPVMEKGKIAGVLTDRDLKRASASDATSLEIHELLYLLSRISVRDIMTPKPIVVPVDYTIEEAADRLLKNRISGP